VNRRLPREDRNNSAATRRRFAALAARLAVAPAGRLSQRDTRARDARTERAHRTSRKPGEREIAAATATRVAASLATVRAAR
jgi:hypothetical protein